jgi:hypothetical protein
MTEINLERLSAYRAKIFRTRPDLILKTIDQAVNFVNERGFIYFWPNKGYLLPSLWNAVAGDRPVPDDHDDPAHISWDWKDKMLGKRAWYYGRLVRRRNTIVSLATAPYFYALSPNYGDYELDYLDQYEMGALNNESKNIYESLLKEGPLDTISLRKAAHLTARDSSSHFNRALEDLQVEMKIIPIGTAEVGAWKYAFVYDIAARHFPDLDAQARTISEEEAHAHLAGLYFQSIGAASVNELRRMFSWRPADCQRALETAIQTGLVIAGLSLQGQKSEWVAVGEVIRE